MCCNLRGTAQLESVIPLRLTSGAFAVYQQLTGADKKDTRTVLRTAFAVNSFTAYEQFVARRLQEGQSDKALVCAFVVGLPEKKNPKNVIKKI